MRRRWAFFMTGLRAGQATASVLFSADGGKFATGAAFSCAERGDWARFRFRACLYLGRWVARRATDAPARRTDMDAFNARQKDGASSRRSR